MKGKDFRRLLQERILVFDGAMGTMLQKMGMQAGQCPELYNLKNKKVVYDIHKQYVDAGCDIIQTNTFGANRIKLAQFGLEDSAREINQHAVFIAREAARDQCLVAGDIGPVGKLLYPLGELTFDETYQAFYEQAKALISAGVDLINIETMSDIYEAKIAVIAAKDAGNVPVICSMTFDSSLRTLTGSDPESAATILEGLGADVIGTNCGFGPDMMTGIVERMYEITDSYLIAQPNAGLPKLVDNQSVFDLTPEKMAGYMEKLVAAGANIIGGCCGTTPEHMARIAAAVRVLKPVPKKEIHFSKLASGTGIVMIGNNLPTNVIGECINPTARKYLAQAIKDDQMDILSDEAVKQKEAGAQIIDVNVGVKLEGYSEAVLMEKAVTAVQWTVNTPLSIDTVDPAAMEAALKVYRGKPLLNSTNGEDESLNRVLGIAKKYGAAVLGLTLDGSGIPYRAEERFKIAEKIVSRALEIGIRKEDIYIDTLTLTAGAQQQWVGETLKALQMVKERLGIKTILGVSNISHGLPNRPDLTGTFLAMALQAGLDIPILNPYHENMWTIIKSSDVLTGRDMNAKKYIQWANDKKEQQPSTAAVPVKKVQGLLEAIKDGAKEKVPELLKQLKQQNMPAMEIINQYVIKALEEVGSYFEQGIYFLPQLLMAAETAELIFKELEEELNQTTQEKIGTFVIATVKGDIHDIGKNIVAIMLKNHGFRVIDLGKDVPTQRIIETAEKEKADIIGLSALMTTTMPEMKNVVNSLKEKEIRIPVMVGGAVVTDEYARSIGAHYSFDAVDAVKVAKKLIRDRR